MDLVEKPSPAERKQARAVDAGLERAGRELPSDARVLVHGQHLRLGLGRPSLSDAPFQQSGFAYSQWRSPERVYAALRDFGVTHVLWSVSPAIRDREVNELVFHDFVAHYAVEQQRIGSYWLARMPDKAPVLPEDNTALVMQCGATQLTTLSELDHLLSAGLTEQHGGGATSARFVLARDGCTTAPRAPYVLLTSQSGYGLFSRSLRLGTP